MRLTGKVAVVTGGARGIGGATAEALARDGARVAIGDLRSAEASETLGRIGQAGGEAAFVQTDVTDVARARGEDASAARERAARELGDPMGVARVLAFLASDEADYVRGSVFTR